MEEKILKFGKVGKWGRILFFISFEWLRAKSKIVLFRNNFLKKDRFFDKLKNSYTSRKQEDITKRKKN